MIYDLNKSQEPLNEGKISKALKAVTGVPTAFEIFITKIFPLCVAAIGITAVTLGKLSLDIRKAINVYPLLHKDCKKLSEYTKKVYNIKIFNKKKFWDNFKHEMPDAKKKIVESFFGRGTMNKGVCYYDKNNNPVAAYVFRAIHTVNMDRYQIKYVVIDKELKKHDEYYGAQFLKQERMATNSIRIMKWAEDVLKEYKEFKKNSKVLSGPNKKLAEACFAILESVDED